MAVEVLHKVLRNRPLVVGLPVIEEKVSGFQNEVGRRDNDQSRTFQLKNYLNERRNGILTN